MSHPNVVWSELIIDENTAYCDWSEVKIKREYFDMIPRHSEKEYDQMKRSIENEGQEKPVIVDQNMVLIDGFTRYKIIKELGNRRLYYQKRNFKNRNEVLRCMAIGNLHRRNLTQYQKVLLYHELYLEEKKKAMERRELAREKSTVTLKNIYASKAPSESAIKSGRGRSGQPLIEDKSPPIEDQSRARTAYAKIIGVSDVAVHQTHYIKEYGGKRINQQVKDNKISMRDAYWKSKERMQVQQTTENLKKYIITITPESGSRWQIMRKLKPTQVHRLKQFIEKLNVEKFSTEITRQKKFKESDHK